MLHANREIAYFMYWANKLLNAGNGQLYCPFHVLSNLFAQYMKWTIKYYTLHEMCNTVYISYTQIVKLPISCIGPPNCSMRVIGNCIFHFME